MTDFNKIKDYYRYFDEKNRLVNSGSGRLEYMMNYPPPTTSEGVSR